MSAISAIMLSQLKEEKKREMGEKDNEIRKSECAESEKTK